jgi:hypothetical protein
VLSLYTHWLGRQRRKLPAFIVLNAGPHHRPAERKSEKAKGKRKVDWVEVGSDEEEETSSTEDEAAVEKELPEDDTGSGVPEEAERPLKYGPPVKNVAGPSNWAGPSKKGQDANVDADEGRNKRPSANQAHLKKRKPEEDLAETPPAKLLKSMGEGKSRRATAKVQLQETLETVPVSNPNQASKGGPSLTYLG